MKTTLMQLASCLVVFASAHAAGTLPEKVEFNRDIRPILSDNCFYCHGPDKNHRKAELRLDVREGALEKKAFVPGDASGSELVKRLHSTDPDELMPPPDSNKKLTAQQKELLKRWVAQGGEYQLHWAYEKPRKAEIEAGRNGVDELVGRRLREVGLKASKEADRRTLIRRVYSDLLGLPPSPEEVAEFERDPSPGAYAKMVEKVLANPHYGERMALGWLDVVRYADTIGYHSDTYRNVWPYRDWVIRSFNANKRFDRFTLEQLAGDLLPDATQETRVGSAFNRLLLTTEEGGAQPKDYEARMLTDRVRAVGAAWLGQTTGCSQCHDHKFDPFTTRDFYALGAFFADIKEGVIGKVEEGMLVPDSEEASKLKELEGRVARLREELEADSEERRAWQKTWEAALGAGQLDGSWTPLVAESLSSEKGTKLEQDAEGIVTVGTAPKVPPQDAYIFNVKTPPGLVTGFKLEALSSEELPHKGPGRSATGNFVLNEFVVKEGTNTLKIAEATATSEQKASGAKLAADGRTNVVQSGWSPVGGVGDSAIYFEMEKPIAGGKTVSIQLRQFAGDNQTLGRWRLSATTLPKPVRAPNVQYPESVLKLVQTPEEKRNPAQRAVLAKHFRAVSPAMAPQREAIEAAQNEQTQFERSVGRCLVSVSTENKRTVRVLPRGNFLDESGEVMKAALPGYLPGPKFEGREPTRLDLAQWLVSKDNPLTARTVMNRLWKQFFGTGLSRVLDDLGAQGEPPRNPALLDWLACEFMDSGWDFKHMVRTIVNSATYRQVSTASPELLAADPENREVARQTPFRLDAELIRDNALRIAGLLVPKIGGRSVKPYQPERYWENLNFPVREWQNDSGESLYRRGLYTWWQRTFLHPSLLAFDAPSREECCAERNRSNIPQQALVLLNDPTYVEAARVFAARVVSESKGGFEERLNRAYQLAVQRSARVEEVATLRALWEKSLGSYSKDPDAAAAFLKTGAAPQPEGVDPRELAAWAHVCRVLLNLHETITRA